ncbi:probable RNA helicase armi [Melanaphis sacchari]|uniref:probable RNA helicase armi n=1 Tax=Melanaphis sacchari TaxID=742174 RepID=UPI000DC14117|nr:probable RNA helicase armi [Melanaphis sacchari]
MKILFDLQNDPIVPGIPKGNKTQFPSVRLAQWSIPSQLTKCYWSENGKFNENNIFSEVRSKIQRLYPVTFENLTYGSYRLKFHTLLFMEEIEITASLQKYAQKRIHFEKMGKYLVLQIPNLSEQRPSLIIGDRITVTDPPNCTKKLGQNYEGVIHKVLANEIWLKFNSEFHNICGHFDYSVNFFNARMIYRKQHEVINEMWKKNRLGESFLFPFKNSLEYQPSKLKILSDDEIKTDNTYKDNLKKDSNTLLPKPNIVQKIRWFNNELNFKQKSAVINILKGEGRPMPYIIFGPPGTGKTITITESIIQVYKEFSKSKLLICAPTNSAVDLLLSKLVNSGLFDNTIMKRLVGYNYFNSSSYNKNYDEYCGLPELESTYYGGEETESLQFKSIHFLDSRLIKKQEILKLRLVLTTEGTAGLLYMMGLKAGTFTHIFIDEAGQSTEPEILLPLSFLDPYRDGQVVLAGDPKQLGPVVLSNLASQSGLGLSMLSRFINYPSYLRDTNNFPEHNGYNPKLITCLIQNYRALPEILLNYNTFFYESLLVPTILSDNSQERILLNNLNKNAHWDIDCKGPVIVHGIVGVDSQEPSSPSWYNPHEAFQILLYFTRLLKSGISADDIGIITPYIAQVYKINELLKMYHPDIKLPRIGTIEMFQGQEKMVIIISMVRSKSRAGCEKDKIFKMGFLCVKERTNVALSRAKALLIIIGNPSTMELNCYWKVILSTAIENKNYIGCNILEY